MFENPRRGRQARNFTTNVPKILVLKSSSEQIFFRKLSLGAPGLPPKEKTNINIIKFSIHLENKKADHYAKYCLQISKDMTEKNQMSLMKIVNTLCNNPNLSELYLND